MNILSASEVAELLRLDKQTVYRNAKMLGGAKIGRRWLFDKDIVRDVLFGGINAKQGEEKGEDHRLESASPATGNKKRSALQNKGRSPGPGITVDSRDKPSADRNRHGLGLG